MSSCVHHCSFFLYSSLFNAWHFHCPLHFWIVNLHSLYLCCPWYWKAKYATNINTQAVLSEKFVQQSWIHIYTLRYKGWSFNKMLLRHDRMYQTWPLAFWRFLILSWLCEGYPWSFEIITILSIGLHIIQNNLHSHQVQQIWDIWLNYPTVALNGYDPVPFWRLIPPLHRSTSHYVGFNCTGFLMYYYLNANCTIAFHQNLICVNNIDTSAFLWTNK